MNDDTINAFAAGLRGKLIRRGDAEYDEAANSTTIDKRPLLSPNAPIPATS